MNKTTNFPTKCKKYISLWKFSQLRKHDQLTQCAASNIYAKQKAAQKGGVVKFASDKENR